ncbi:MAG TPA: UDP-N-acetylglucosamine--N-acetylmuramyl-(pentapeptide) pyrophosphoryl-undecaprenol N-acetylglucosamine transferase [Candidatus Saccharimonadales bacterium]|nr:UDP-N-acetylglucosamine--N-acetylmuramyl-(pentapeptide) pyrophosphoryl-undecaprenol N-acetylglucosamine transferase [Candidatus Saccharimonadales bacterium]
MKILAVGGGSGGHVTPAVAVLRELKRGHADLEIRFWCDRKFGPQARSIVHHFDGSILVETIIAGKLRRYHTLPFWKQLLRPFSILLPNIRDIFLVGCGLVQSIIKLVLWRPDVIFTKGGYVCLPVGCAAWLLNIPLVIHDSDTHPGLTNRILARFATAIATGAPLKYYPYPENKSFYVGTPVGKEFKPVEVEKQRELKAKLGFDIKRPLVVITGGGLGAQNINDAVVKRLSELLEITSVVLIAGAGLYDEVKALTPQDDPRFQLHPFISGNMQEYLGAADVVIARAGATTILELAALAKPTVLIPSPYLTGGHQLKNAAVYAENGAVEVIDELELDANPQLLVDTLAALLANPRRRAEMGALFHDFAKPHAAKDMAEVIKAILTPRG